MSDKLSNHSEEEFRAEQSEKVVEFLERSGSYEYFQSIVSGKEKIPDFEKFEDFIIRINGIARDIPISERHFDGENVGLKGFVENVIVPRHKDKEGLLRYAYEAIPEIDRDDLKYMLPAVINAVHPFNDGNGRTSRITHLLLGGWPSKEAFFVEAKKALGESGRFDSLNIDPGLITFDLERGVLANHGWVFDEENPNGRIGSIKEGLGYDVKKFNESNPKEKLAKEFLGFNDGYYEATAVYMLLGDKGVASLFSEYGNKEEKRTAISVQKMLDTLEVEEWEKLIENFWKLKREQVELLVDIFREPEKHKTERGEGKITIKDAFIDAIEKRGNFL